MNIFIFLKWSNRRHLFLLGIILFQAIAISGQVKINEETITIPTYKNGDPNPMPRFYEEGNRHQGIKRFVYPYPMDDNTSNIKTDQNYHIIHIENEYLDLGIIPELGGRIYYAKDKTNNYDFFYRNNVIKPSLIGMMGNWISGSLAWGFPHHHGPNTVKPMDYTIEEKEDGSKTIWISSGDQLYRMSVLIGYTIYPNSSIVEMTMRPMNDTPISNSFLFWAVPAVHCDENYQVIYPPSVKYVAFHYKRDITTWPIADGVYNNYDFSGVDISWWKNTFVPSSFFAWEPKEDYFCGYDHKKEAGTAWIGNHYVSPGMKFWADGNNSYGRLINNGLTDNDGRYIELMSGFCSDNQPDYSWIQPYETKSGKMIWFPIRELGGLKYANQNGALNLEVADKKIIVKINTTSPYKEATVVLRSKEQEIIKKIISISPAEPFKIDVPLPEGIVENDLDLLLCDNRGNSLLGYKPADYNEPIQYPRPEPLKAMSAEDPYTDLKLPEEMKTVEELYLTGLRLNQFYSSFIDPMLYYKEALKRDPDDYRVNTQLGIINIKNFKWDEAEKNLRTAIDRITTYYTRPKDGEALYYLGLALKAQGKTDEAYDYFYKASWSSAWNTASYYQLAEIDCRKGDFLTALDHINRSISTNTENLKALNLRAILLRKLKNYEDARIQIIEILKKDKLNHQALNELYWADISLGNTGQISADLNTVVSIMRDEVQSYIELATDYMDGGFYKEATELLSRLENKGNKFPMLYYYIGYLYTKQGDQDKAIKYCQLANEMPYEYCFPFRAEEIEILKSAKKINPSDSYAPYYLGNLLYEHQPEQAINEWEKSCRLNDSFYIVHRNLGLAYKEVKEDYKKAIASMQKAYSCKNDDPRLLLELDELNNLNNVSAEEKYKFLKTNFETVKERSETLLRFVIRAIENGKYGEAIAIINNYRFVVFERSRERQKAYLDAYTLRGMKYLREGDIKKALIDIQTAQAYPRWYEDVNQSSQFYYFLGIIYKRMGNLKKANAMFSEALKIDATYDVPDYEFIYYKGKSYEELGNIEESRKLFTSMLDSALKNRENKKFPIYSKPESMKYMLKNHFVAGLAYEGLNEKDKAKAEYTKVLEIDPGHIWSKTHLEIIK